MILEIRQYPKVAYCRCLHPVRFERTVPGQTSRTGLKMNGGGRAGSQTRICSFGRCRVVLLHYPPFWNSRRESNPDLFVRTEASSCLRPREPIECGGDAKN
jgi:hypothetical protein